MADSHALDLVSKGLVTDQIVLSVGYDIENLQNPEIYKNYKGEIVTDHYGRKMPKHAHGTINLKKPTSSAKEIIAATLQLFDRITDKNLLIRRLNITTNHVLNEKVLENHNQNEQLDLFTDYEALLKIRANEKAVLEREKKMQKAIISIKNRYGKNAIFKGMNLQETSTALDRNRQIGGHKA
jgi:DNA polymerase V